MFYNELYADGGQELMSAWMFPFSVRRRAAFCR
jgi:hypothetical protein